MRLKSSFGTVRIVACIGIGLLLLACMTPSFRRQQPKRGGAIEAIKSADGSSVILRLRAPDGRIVPFNAAFMQGMTPLEGQDMSRLDGVMFLQIEWLPFNREAIITYDLVDPDGVQMKRMFRVEGNTDDWL